MASSEAKTKKLTFLPRLKIKTQVQNSDKTGKTTMLATLTAVFKKNHGRDKVRPNPPCLNQGADLPE